MHPVLTDMIVKQVRQRRDEGDCPTIPAESVERLEDAIIDLAGRLDKLKSGHPIPHDCQFCGGSMVEMVDGGNGNVFDQPCSICCAPSSEKRP